jgi:hypothetical protein
VLLVLVWFCRLLGPGCFCRYRVSVLRSCRGGLLAVLLVLVWFCRLLGRGCPSSLGHGCCRFPLAPVTLLGFFVSVFTYRGFARCVASPLGCSWR